MKLQPIVILARADELNDAIRAKPNAKIDSMEQYRKKIAQEFQIGIGDIYPGVPYVNERQRTFEIDRLTFKILLAAGRRAEMKKHQLKADKLISEALQHQADQEQLNQQRQERQHAQDKKLKELQHKLQAEEDAELLDQELERKTAEMIADSQRRRKVLKQN